MTNFIIRDDIPIPAPRSSLAYMLPLEQMGIGQCIDLPIESTRLVATAIARCAKLKAYGQKAFTSRTLKEEGVVRIWRVK
jgi:BarA-like signal transduction histidine kinase